MGSVTVKHKIDLHRVIAGTEGLPLSLLAVEAVVAVVAVVAVIGGGAVQSSILAPIHCPEASARHT